MKSTIAAVILALVVFGGLLYFFVYQKQEPSPLQAQLPTPTEERTSTATSYDECVAEGGKTLPDAPDKCLTVDGHIFIQGVVE